jgi:hypothetical protein
MKLPFLIRWVLPFFIIAPSAVAEGEKSYSRINWSQLQTFPASFSFEGEITGYLSIFYINGFWYSYLYQSREALKEHDVTAFIKLDSEQFGTALGLTEFTGNEELLKALDQRCVRIEGLFLTAETSISDEPYFSEKIVSMRWRDKNGQWTSDQKKGLEVPALKEGRIGAFPNATFFKDK